MGFLGKAYDPALILAVERLWLRNGRLYAAAASA
jgi:hypothetical protein